MVDSVNKLKVAVLGASGYTGADVVRLLARHPMVRMTALTAERHAGQPLGDVFPHLGLLDLPDLIRIEDVDWSDVDFVVCCLPHGKTQKVIAGLPHGLKVIDLSADFRLNDVQTYAEWYGHEHYAPELQPEAAYGLTELNRLGIAKARLVACPGCYPTATLLALMPPLMDDLILPDDIIIDAKSGVTGAGRSLKEELLFGEVGEGTHAYSIGRHRHAPEIEQELSLAAGRSVTVNFTPHLLPMNRGELVTCHVKLAAGVTSYDLREELFQRYAQEPFVHVVPEGVSPATRHVRGSNHCLIGVFPDRIPGRAIVIAAIDNLVKGSGGQAVQNLNVMIGVSEVEALDALALFP